MESKEKSKIKQVRRGIIILSIIIPLVVAVLFNVDKIEGVDFSFLPPIYATINGLTAILLVGALMAIKKKKTKVHEYLIRTCLFLSLIFLGCYVAYHMTSDSTMYEGQYEFIYYPLLISHIVLSVAVVPLVLFTFLFAWEGNFKKHKKWTRVTWPLWFYVAASGVVVYLFISPFYS